MLAFTEYAFPAFAGATPRSMPTRLREVFNVADYGAVANSTNGTNGTDATAAIQSAINAMEAAKGGILFFPRGTAGYRITSPLNLNALDVSYRIEGAPGALLVGDFNGAIMSQPFTSSGPTGGSHEWVGLRFIQNHTSGKGLLVNASVGAKVQSCSFAGKCGVHLETWGSQAVTVDSCVMIGAEGTPGVGIMAGNSTYVLNCDVTHCNEGIRHHNLGLVISGGRWEVNGIAIRLGKLPDDTQPAQSTGVTIEGLSMESNWVGIQFNGAAAMTIRDCAVTVNETNKRIGLECNGGEEITVENVSVACAPLTDSLIKITSADRLTFRNVRTNAPSGVEWSIAEGLNSFVIEQCLDRNGWVGVTVAQLPVAAYPGTRLYVKDASSPSVGSAPVGGGATGCVCEKQATAGWVVRSL